MRLIEGSALESSSTHHTWPPATVVLDSDQDPSGPQSHLGPERSLQCLWPHRVPCGTAAQELSKPAYASNGEAGGDSPSSSHSPGPLGRKGCVCVCVCAQVLGCPGTERKGSMFPNLSLGLVCQ